MRPVQSAPFASVVAPAPIRRRLAHIPELDGVRGLAALMVFFHHLCFTSITSSGWNTLVLLLRRTSAVGAYGVDLFFVLSGFLITSILIEDRKKPTFYRDFYWKRALRILPLYIACLIVIALFVPGSRGYVLASAAFIANFAWLFHITTEGPFWTLAIEEQFYLIWPTVVRPRSVAELRRWAIGIGLSAVIFRLIAAAFGHHDYYFTFFHCDGLAFGALLACWYTQKDPDDGITRSNIRFAASALAAGVIFIALAYLPEDGPRSASFAAAFQLTAVTLLCGITIAFLIARSGQKHLAFLRSGLLNFFGLISYAMYMTHLFIMRAYDHFRGPLVAGDYAGYIVRFVSVLVLTVLLSVLIRYVIELPAMRLRKYVLQRAPERTADLQ